MSVSKLLIVFTRMYAEKCGDGDEFTEIWGGPEDCTKTHLVFPPEPAGQERVVLVMHGHDYPDFYAAEISKLAADSIHPALGGLGAENRELGIAFHSPQSWEDSEVSAFARELQGVMVGAGYVVKFSNDYRNGSPLQMRLAKLCREGIDLAEEFDSIWADNMANNPDDRHMGGIRHKIINYLSPIQRDLEAWREAGFDRETGRELFRCYGDGKAQNTVRTVRDLVEQSTHHRNTVENVMVSVKHKSDDEERMKKIEGSFGTLKGLFGGDPLYQSAAEVFAVFAERPAAGAEDEAVERLRERLTAKDHVKKWYDAVLKAFDELREEICR